MTYRKPHSSTVTTPHIRRKLQRLEANDPEARNNKRKAKARQHLASLRSAPTEQPGTPGAGGGSGSVTELADIQPGVPVDDRITERSMGGDSTTRGEEERVSLFQDDGVERRAARVGENGPGQSSPKSRRNKKRRNKSAI